MHELSEYVVMGIILYVSIGMLVLCLVPNVYKLLLEVGYSLPDKHVRYTTLVMLAWPFAYYIYRHYYLEVLRVAREKEFGELRDLQQRAISAARGDNGYVVQPGHASIAE